VDFVIQKLSFVNTAVCCSHFTLMALIIFPFTAKLTPVNPANNTVTFPFSSAPVTLVSCLLKLVSVLAGQTVVVLHSTEATRSTILECTSELVTVFEVYHAETKNYITLNLILTSKVCC